MSCHSLRPVAAVQLVYNFSYSVRPFLYVLPTLCLLVSPIVATTADCPTLRTLFEEAYQSGKRDYSSPYGWLEYNGYGVYIPQCLQNGSFATVQCSNISLPINTTALPYYYSSSSRSRYCWCVDPATGIATTSVYRYDSVPSPEECPYFNTTTLCQVREYVSVCRSVLCCAFLHGESCVGLQSEMSKWLRNAASCDSSSNTAQTGSQGPSCLRTVPP